MPTFTTHSSGGHNPIGVCYANGHIWVTNQGSGKNIVKISAVTGAVLASYAAVGSGFPTEPIFAAGQIWYANNSNVDPSVTVLNEATGALVGTFAVANFPNCLVFDGTYVWCAGASATLTQFLAAVPAITGTFTVPTGGLYGCFDGTRLWFTRSVANSIYAVLAATGAVIGTYAVPGTPTGIAFDGTNLWVTENSTSADVAQVSTAGAILQTITIAGTGPGGIIFDSFTGTLWAAAGFSEITNFSTTGAIIASYILPPTDPTGPMALDAAGDLWGALQTTNEVFTTGLMPPTGGAGRFEGTFQGFLSQGTLGGGTK
jgi:hypothetical protein